MTIKEFKKRNPGTKGTLCWNCTESCSVRRYNECKKTGKCDDFVQSVVKEVVDSEILKAFRKEYSDACDEARYTVNHMVPEHHWW